MADPRDHDHMRAALALARRGLGRTWPNPAVGCVIVKAGRVIGRGWTQPGGRPHAEAVALERAGEAARDATAYVTLEPCCDFPGRQRPSCAEALVAAGVTRVVAAVEDPYPQISGNGFTRLRAAGIAVDVGDGSADAQEINAGFFSRVRHGRPLVTLKLASSLDGRIATASGESRWITGPAARARAHLLRATHDAVLVGTGTALADDPQLTCRLPGLAARSPVRVVLDRQLRLPATLRLFAEARETPTWVATAPDADGAQLRRLAGLGVEILAVPRDAESGLALGALLRALGDKGLTRLLVEGGGALAAGLLRAGLVDRLVWMRAPLAIGGDGLPSLGPLAFGALAQAPRFTLAGFDAAGGDLIETYRRVD